MTNSKGNLPKQQAQQPQPIEHDVGKERTRENLGRMIARDIEDSLTPDVMPNPFIDEARFNAGIVNLYKKIESEPVPAEILELIEKLAKRERS